MDALSQRLRSERERQRLSVRDVAVVTKIREPHIEAIERGAYDVLPAVYVRSFVRTLGTALGIPQHEITSLMNSVFDTSGADAVERLPRATPPPVDRPDAISTTMHAAGDLVAVKTQQAAEKATKALVEGVGKLRELTPPSFLPPTSRRTTIIIAAVMALLVAAVLWLVFNGNDDNDTTTTTSEIDVGEIVGDYENTADSMELRAEVGVGDSVWISIRMDAGRTVQQLLEPGSEHTWRAQEKFTMSVSNAGGVTFYRNDAKLPIFGRSGQTVREVVITRTDTRSSNQPVDEQPAQIQQPVQQPVSQPVSQPRPQSQPESKPQARPQPKPRPKPQAKPRQQNKKPPVPIIAPAPIQRPDLRPSQDNN